MLACAMVCVAFETSDPPEITQTKFWEQKNCNVRKKTRDFASTISMYPRVNVQKRMERSSLLCMGKLRKIRLGHGFKFALHEITRGVPATSSGIQPSKRDGTSKMWEFVWNNGSFMSKHSNANIGLITPPRRSKTSVINKLRNWTWIELIST